MADAPESTRADEAAHRSARRALELRPFRAVRYAGRQGHALAAVTAPPYDVIDDDALLERELADPYNAVRLIRPHVTPVEGDPYQAAGRRWRDWLASGELVRDDEDALYVYEQRTESTLQRGVVGALGLREADEGVVLPHEDVMPGPVADRLALMRATRANLEPILLSVQGGRRTDEVVHAVVRTAPLLDTTTADGVRHRVWRIDGPDDLRAVQEDLAPRSALIADGHHRYETYLQLRASADGEAAAYDYGLALLVDTTRYPLEVGSIHRVVTPLDVTTALERAAVAFAVEELADDVTEWRARLTAARQRGPALVVAAAGRAALLSDPDPGAVTVAMPPGHSVAWQQLDASVADHLLISALWGPSLPADARIDYVHDVDSAVRAAERGNGCAVLLAPIPLTEVTEIAATGERLPRKSTSFAPKPLTGLLFRSLDED